MKRTIFSVALVLMMAGGAMANNGAVAKTAENALPQTVNTTEHKQVKIVEQTMIVNQNTAITTIVYTIKLPQQIMYVCFHKAEVYDGVYVSGCGVSDTSQADACAQAKYEAEKKAATEIAWMINDAVKP